jgi:hypothetical protein
MPPIEEEKPEPVIEVLAARGYQVEFRGSGIIPGPSTKAP